MIANILVINFIAFEEEDCAQAQVKELLDMLHASYNQPLKFMFFKLVLQ